LEPAIDRAKIYSHKMNKNKPGAFLGIFFELKAWDILIVVLLKVRREKETNQLHGNLMVSVCYTPAKKQTITIC
jgi:hypothetical protein